MVKQDTIRLLRECDSGIKMGIQAVNEVKGYVKSKQLRDCLDRNLSENERMKSDLQELLDEYGDEGKNPDPIAKGMSWIKTNVKMTVDTSDSTAAEIMTDGCNMGIKSLSRYLNQYKAADERSKAIAKRLISSEENLSNQMRGFL